MSLQQMTEDELLRRFSIELKALAVSGRSAVLPPLDPTMAWAIFCGLQLALKHPQNIGPLSEVQRSVAKQLEAYLTEGYPAMGEVARRGWQE